MLNTCCRVYLAAFSHTGALLWLLRYSATRKLRVSPPPLLAGFSRASTPRRTAQAAVFPARRRRQAHGRRSLHSIVWHGTWRSRFPDVLLPCRGDRARQRRRFLFSASV